MSACLCGCGREASEGRTFIRGHHHTTKAMTRETWMDKFGAWFVPIPETGCWIWVRSRTTGGYGNFSNGRNKIGYAHRVSYELLRGPIPKGMTIDHLCRVRCCVNPDHLEVVTASENSRRNKRTHCRRGHEITVENTYFDRPEDHTSHRHCRICTLTRIRRSRVVNEEMAWAS